MPTASRLCCNCDMPYEVYVDWLEEQGWDVSELREMDNEEWVPYWGTYNPVEFLSGDGGVSHVRRNLHYGTPMPYLNYGNALDYDAGNGFDWGSVFGNGYADYNNDI